MCLVRDMTKKKLSQLGYNHVDTCTAFTKSLFPFVSLHTPSVSLGSSDDT